MSLLIEYEQKSWKELEERSYDAISFYFSEKPKSKILLTEDNFYNNSFNYHVCFGELLNDQELEILGKAIISFIQPGWNLLVCGESNKEKERFYNYLLESPFLEDTGCIRVLKDKKYYKILRKYRYDN